MSNDELDALSEALSQGGTWFVPAGSYGPFRRTIHVKRPLFLIGGGRQNTVIRIGTDGEEKETELR